DGDNASLRAAIRAHAHFAEYVPIIVLIVGALELLGTPAVQLHMLLGTLLVARIIHPFGLEVKPGTMQFLVGRVFGMTAHDLRPGSERSAPPARSGVEVVRRHSPPRVRTPLVLAGVKPRLSARYRQLALQLRGRSLCCATLSCGSDASSANNHFEE